MKHIAYIAMGSNLGSKLLQCQKAVAQILKVDRHKLLAQSSFYKTQPLGYTTQDWFINGVIKIETHLEAHELLWSLKAIESSLGRQETFRWGPRTIDLDLLFYDQEQIRSEELVLPTRAFMNVSLSSFLSLRLIPIFFIHCSRRRFWIFLANSKTIKAWKDFPPLSSFELRSSNEKYMIIWKKILHSPHLLLMHHFVSLQ